MERSELIMRMLLATRIIIPIFGIIALIKLVKDAWEAGTLLFFIFVGFLAIGLIAIFVILLLGTKKRDPSPLFSSPPLFAKSGGLEKRRNCLKSGSFCLG